MRSASDESRAFMAGLLTGAALVGLTSAALVGVAILAAGAGRRTLRRERAPREPGKRRRPSSPAEEGLVFIDGATPPSEAELDARPPEESPRAPLESEAEWDVSPESERW